MNEKYMSALKELIDDMNHETAIDGKKIFDLEKIEIVKNPDSYLGENEIPIQLWGTYLYSPTWAGAGEGDGESELMCQYIPVPDPLAYEDYLRIVFELVKRKLYLIEAELNYNPCLNHRP